MSDRWEVVFGFRVPFACKRHLFCHFSLSPACDMLVFRSFVCPQRTAVNELNARIVRLMLEAYLPGSSSTSKFYKLQQESRKKAKLKLSRGLVATSDCNFVSFVSGGISLGQTSSSYLAQSWTLRPLKWYGAATTDARVPAPGVRY